MAVARALEEVGQRERGANRGARAGRSTACRFALVIAEALEHRALVRAHPFHHLGLGEVLPVQEDVDLSADARFALEHAQALKRRQVLRHELRDVRLHGRLRGESPARGREHEADAEDRPARRAARPRAPPARSAAAARSRARARARRARRPRSRRPRPLAGRDPGPRCPRARPPRRRTSAHTRSAIATPATSSTPNPWTSGTGESSSPSIAPALASAASAIVGRAACDACRTARTSVRRAVGFRARLDRRATGAGSRSPPRAPRAPVGRRASRSSASRRRAQARRT